MGLDAFVRIPVITDDADASDYKEIWYGRKENEIHGWMQRQSGIDPDDFNCVSLPITHELLDQLKKDVLKGELTSTAGFFFGDPNELEEIKKAVTALIQVSRAALMQGNKPYYFSWW